LDDTLEAIARIQKYISGFGCPEFAEDTRTQDAVVRNLEIIGEAVGRSSARSDPLSRLVRDFA
jgi:uncharacterized protein with HEPN domain